MADELISTKCCLPYAQKTARAAFDLGGSTGKAIIVESHTDNLLHLNLVRFKVATQLDAVISYMSTHAQLCCAMPIHCTGAKASGDSLQKLQREFDISDEILFEFDCTFRCFGYLIRNNLLPNWVFAPRADLEQQWIAKYAAFYQNKKLDDDVLPEFTRDPDASFPCYALYVGSGMHLGKLFEDGHYEPLYGSGGGGKQVLALGMQLTGAKSYGEFMELCESGQALNVDISTRCMTAEQEDAEADPFFAHYLRQDEVTVFPLGKILDNPHASFSPADIARSILSAEINRMVYTVTGISNYEGIKQVFVYGGFAESSLVQNIMTEVFIRHAMVQKYHQGKKIVARPYFMKHASFLPCIGALMKPAFPEPTDSDESGWLPL